MTIINPVERHLFFEGILMKYGYDFRQYAEASLDRRLVNLMIKYRTQTLLDVLKLIMDDPEQFRAVLGLLTINTTEFFRDPSFFRTLRESVLPLLQTYPKINIWSAGCSTGEEVVSLAILLKEEGLDKRATIYATDVSPQALKTAKEGIYENSCIAHFNRNYALAGGTRSPSEYYSAEYGLVRFSPSLFSNVVFSEHNLVTDSVFIEAHLILCRNVLIYFTRELQDRVFTLFSRSLVHKGVLGIGSKESIRFSRAAPFFSTLHHEDRFYQFNARAEIGPGSFLGAVQ